jgi:hypothetical protein
MTFEHRPGLLILHLYRTKIPTAVPNYSSILAAEVIQRLIFSIKQKQKNHTNQKGARGFKALVG